MLEMLTSFHIFMSESFQFSLLFFLETKLWVTLLCCALVNPAQLCSFIEVIK